VRGFFSSKGKFIEAFHADYSWILQKTSPCGNKPVRFVNSIPVEKLKAFQICSAPNVMVGWPFILTRSYGGIVPTRSTK